MPPPKAQDELVTDRIESRSKTLLLVSIREFEKVRNKGCNKGNISFALG